MNLIEAKKKLWKAIDRATKRQENEDFHYWGAYISGLEEAQKILDGITEPTAKVSSKKTSITMKDGTKVLFNEVVVDTFSFTIPGFKIKKQGKTVSPIFVAWYKPGFPVLGMKFRRAYGWTGMGFFKEYMTRDQMV